MSEHDVAARAGEPGSSPDAEPDERPRRSRRWLIWGGVAVIAALGVGVVAALPLFAAPDPSAAEDRPQVTTEEVRRGSIETLVRGEGKLGFAGKRTVGTEISGTITAAPQVGSVVGQGGELFRVDDVPVSLLFGGLPAWRDFAVDMSDGRDVQQLEENLAALGYFGDAPDEHFDWVTREAIREWQRDLDVEATGELAQGRVVFAPGELRVDQVTAGVGAPAGADVLTATGTQQRVIATVKAKESGALAVGGSVTLEFPNGTSSTGTVTELGAPKEEEDQMGKKQRTVTATVTVDDPAAAEGTGDATIRVSAPQVLAEDTLIVPVVSLVPEPGGGYAIRLQEPDGQLVSVPVELGAFGDGEVAVSGDGVAEGDNVVVPS